MDKLVKFGNIIAWIVVALAFYFGGQSNLTERLAVAETKIQQELIGYQVIQSSLGARLERIEKKVDCLIDKRLCN
jgi:hypothetical protein